MSPPASGDAPYYELLGLGPAATHDDVVHAYRRLARSLHPDVRPGDPEALQRFREITEAYELLTGPGRRPADVATDPRHRIPVHHVAVAVGDGPRRGFSMPPRRGTEDPPVFLCASAAHRADDVTLRAGPTRIEQGSGVDAGASNARGWSSGPVEAIWALIDSWWRA